MSLGLITRLRNYAADITRQCIDGDIPVPKSALLNIVDALKEAAMELERREPSTTQEEA